MQNKPEAIQATLSDVAETIFDYPGGKLSDRCRVIYAAYNEHVITLKDMTYALMQYEKAEIAAGNIRTNRLVPAKPDLPDKNAERDVWAAYREKLDSYQIVVDKNYDGVVSIRKLEEFELAIKDDDYDYCKAKECGAYIVTGVVDGAVKAYIGDLILPPPADAEAESDIPF